MLNFKKYNKVTIAFILVILFISILRIVISFKLPYYYLINTPHDNQLLFSYVHLKAHFNSWNVWALSKNIIYSVFLYIVKISNIPYGIWMGILWVLSGLSVSYVVYKYISKNKLLLLLIYLFILFLPFGFDMSCTSNIYRNGVFIPFVLMFLSSLIIFINLIISNEKENNYKMIILGLIVGILFFINFYIKEDGVVLLPIFIVPIMAAILFRIAKQNNIKSLIKVIIICIIPLIVFSLGTIAYTEINNYYFGVHEINTRTDGELGEFYHNLLLIKDDNKTNVVWIPFSTIEKAWNASPTLRSHPELLSTIENSKWAGEDYKSTPLTADLFSWDLRNSLSNIGLYSNEKEASDFFHQVNQELDNSFNNGTLEKTDKIVISSSIPGKSIDELFELLPSINRAIDLTILYNDIDINTPEATSTHVAYADDLTDVEDIINQELISPNHSTSINQISLMFKIMDFNTFIYQITAIFVILLSFIGFIVTLIHQIKNKFKNRIMNSLLGFQILLFGTFCVEITAVCWFSQACGICNYYLLRCVAYFSLFTVLSISCLIYNLQIDNKFSFSSIKK